MKSYPRANASEGDCVTLSVDLYNRIVDDLERLDRLSVSPPLTMSSGGGGKNIGMRMATQSSEMALVAIIGTETGGGRYKGSILSGNSTGSTTTNFQLNSSLGQSATDGPTMKTSGGVPVNNALVINLPEQYVSNSHLLYWSNPFFYYAWGRVMGQTSESTPRTIVYLEARTIIPVLARITTQYNNSQPAAGIYTGRLMQGMPLCDTTAGFTATLPNALNVASFGTNDICWISNAFEQTSAVAGAAINPAVHGLAVGTYVFGWLVAYALGTPTSTTQNFHLVYTVTPTQAPATTMPTVSPTQLAGGSYTSHEQLMLDQQSQDIHNLQLTLIALYSNLRTGCFSL
jgi:hypothetical protein